MISNKYFLRFLEELFLSYGKIKADIPIIEVFRLLVQEGFPSKSDFMVTLGEKEEPEWENFIRINDLVQDVKETDPEISSFIDITQQAFDLIYEEYKKQKEEKTT